LEGFCSAIELHPPEFFTLAAIHLSTCPDRPTASAARPAGHPQMLVEGVGFEPT
jgi:hypothetical protein